MEEQRRIKVSKFLSLVLRHQPEQIGIQLDAHGWVSIEELMHGFANEGRSITREELQEVVDTSDKQRFAISADGLRIRANQGHSVEVDLGYTPTTPPEMLYHGTSERNIAAIRASGLTKGARHHVHLSGDVETARKVGARHGAAVVLGVRAGAMVQDGHLFYRSANGVWLTESVPAIYLVFPT